MEKKNTLEAELQHLLEEQKEKDAHHHHHHHHDDGEECDDPDCECHHHHDDEDDEHEHHHHHHDDEDGEHEHHHHHHHHHEDGEECDDPDCDCHDHDADEVFTSWGMETAAKFDGGFVEDCLDELMTGRFGMILRAKGILAGRDGEWIHFDYVPGEKEVRFGAADVTGKLCVIGTDLDRKGLKALFTPAE